MCGFKIDIFWKNNEYSQQEIFNGSIARMLMISRCVFLFVLYLCSAVAEPLQQGFSTFGALKYPSSFDHFAYANPKAPQGGEFVLSAMGKFDSFNPYILKGDAAAGLSYLGGDLLHASLFRSSGDEHNSSYGYIAEGMEISADRKQITFLIRKTATFHDGSPILPEDVIFTFQQLRQHGKPFFRNYYKAVERVEKTGPHAVTFFLKDASSQEMPAILGQMPVLSEKFYGKGTFLKATLTPPLGSGPYRVEKVLPGQSVTYKQVESWWGRQVPSTRGFYNFGRIRYDYYRDPAVAFEAFKAGNTDFTLLSSKDWNTLQDFPAVKEGKIIAEVVAHQIPMGHIGFFFNTRQIIFKDRRVRQALGMALDFAWINKNLMFSTYQRTFSYFSNTSLAASGLPSPEERAILLSFKEKLPPEIFTQPIEAFVSTIQGDGRQEKRAALALLKEAGWALREGRLTNRQTGKPFVFEFLSLAGSPLEKILEAYRRSLKEWLGIEMTIRLVDPSQYEALVQHFDFDMIFSVFPGSTHPGNELWNYLGAAQALQQGSDNMAGIQDPVVDHLIQQIIAAPNEETLRLYTRVLDRVLMASFYTVPGWYSPSFRIAYWNKFGKLPQTSLMSGFDCLTWWALPSSP